MKFVDEKHDLSGQRFGRLVVNREAANVDGNRTWWCKCDCGNICVVRANNLKAGQTISCGCYRQEVFKESFKKQKRNSSLARWGKPKRSTP